jgi:hypothetical protein
MAVPKRKKSISWKHFKSGIKTKKINFLFFSEKINFYFNKYYPFFFLKK